MRITREIIEIFENAAASYDKWYGRPIGVYAFRSELIGLEALLPQRGVGVDIGAGTGIFAKCVSTDERSVVCLDPSPGMLQEAKKRGLPSIIAVAEASPIRHGSIDFAYMVTVLEFLPEPLKALYSVGGILREDAPLVILLINRDSSWGEHYSRLAERGDQIFSRAKLYTLGEVSSLLKKAGFEPAESMGTLTASPDEPVEEYQLFPNRRGVGVILIKAKKHLKP
jgi:SAM-dependent methyltransferase